MIYFYFKFDFFWGGELQYFFLNYAYSLGTCFAKLEVKHFNILSATDIMKNSCKKNYKNLSIKMYIKKSQTEKKYSLATPFYYICMQ